MKKQNTKHYFSLLAGFVILLLIASCSGLTQDEPAIVEATSTQTPTPKPTSAPVCVTPNLRQPDSGELGWWNDTVFYEIFVRSFYDSDGDGIGDFNGITQKLDYLNDGDPTTPDDLGITGIWLMPINPSPSYHGYDVTDYFAVNEEYGTMEDLQNLLDEAHQRGIRVIIDMVLNHTSNRHPWFQEASTDLNSPYRDYYVWEDPPPGFDSPWGTDVWYLAETGYYYGIFWVGMPDLNYSNPEVTAEMQEVIRFWLEDVGVDGFRLDAIKHLIEDGTIQENTPATHEWWEGFYDYYTSVNPEAFTVGEAWTSTSEVLKYIGDEMNIAFEFDTAGAILKSAKYELSQYIAESHQLITESYPPHQYATFITNHDQKRVMSELMGETGQAKTAASLLLTGPGVPFLYYGEELGQAGRKPDENIRTPMQWSDEANAGFTTAPIPWRLPQRDYEERNVAVQTSDPDSLLNQYRALIHARNEYPALRVGGWLELPTSERSLYAFLRFTTDQTLMVLVNLSGEPIQDYRFCLSEGPLQAGTANEILWGLEVTNPDLNGNGGFDSYQPLDELEAYTTYIIELK
ncbi:MAG: alpha-amylase family glycosyl hydrolase [Chloroflexota bacterium]|nr:alpha-amylase family glycosyl hydrolase [Chloroflexota bacterium]